MAILLFVNLKGGVAKTTNAVAVAECLATSGLRTLVIDADHQCMAGELLLGESRLLKCERRRMTLHDLLASMLDDEFQGEQVGDFVIDGASNINSGIPNLSVLPCSIRIDDFTTNMAKAKRGYASQEEFQALFRRRRRAIRNWLTNNYDFTIIDCPPSLALQVKLFLTIADSYILPSVPDRLSVRGSMWLRDRIRRHGGKIEGLGTLWSLYRKQNTMHRKFIEHAAKGVEPFDVLPRPFQTVIPNAAAIAESTEPGQTPHSFKAKYTTPFAKLYHELCNEIVQRCEWKSAAQAADQVGVPQS